VPRVVATCIFHQRSRQCNNPRMCTEVPPAPRKFIRCGHTVNVPESGRNIVECEQAQLRGTQCVTKHKASHASSTDKVFKCPRCKEASLGSHGLESQG